MTATTPRNVGPPSNPEIGLVVVLMSPRVGLLIAVVASLAGCMRRLQLHKKREPPKTKDECVQREFDLGNAGGGTGNGLWQRRRRSRRERAVGSTNTETPGEMPITNSHGVQRNARREGKPAEMTTPRRPRKTYLLLSGVGTVKRVR